MDRSAEGSLDGGFEEVEFAHGDTAGRDDYVDAGLGFSDASEGVAEALLECSHWSVAGDAEIDGRETPRGKAGEEGRTVRVTNLAALELARVIMFDQFVASTEDSDAGFPVDFHRLGTCRGEKADLAAYRGDEIAFPEDA